jgi:RimJ/RimL family protein N-acetyltransferase
MTTIIETERLILRTWQKEDANAYHQINQDPKVIEFLRGPLTLEQVNDFIFSANVHHDTYGYTLWAAETRKTRDLIGFIGLNSINLPEHLIPGVEVGWRLGVRYWGKGYATEGAQASLSYGFRQCDLNEIISYTVPANIRSVRVMEKIGLKRDLNGDFAYPKLEPHHRLSHHILYRLTRHEFLT